MNTKLSLLITLALTSVLHAQKPGFNGPRPIANVPSSPSRPVHHSSASGSSHRVNAGQIIGIAQTVLPQVIRAMQSAPQSPPPPRTSAALKTPPSSPRSAQAKKPVISSRTPGKPAGTLDDKNNAAIRQGRQVAEGLRSIEEIRKAIPDALNESLGLTGGGFSHGAGFEKPIDTEGNATNGSRTPEADFSPPAHSGANRGNGLADIRGRYSRSRQGSRASADDMTPTAGRVFESASRLTFGSGSQSTADSAPTYTLDEGNGDVVAEQRGYDSAGNAAAVVVIESHDRDGAVAGTKEMVYHIDVDGKTTIDVVARDPEGRVVAQGTTRSCDRTPGDVAMGGPVNGAGPSVADVSGLMPLDLVRQHANGEAPRGGVNYMTSGSLHSRHVNPGSTEAGALPSTRTRSSAPITTDTLAGPTSGGSNGGGNRPD